MYCQKCGTQNPEGANNCQNCGAPLNAAPAKPKKKKALIIILAVVAVLFIAIIVPSPDDSQQTTSQASTAQGAEQSNEPKATEKSTTAVSLENRNALAAALNYLDYTAFSAKGLKEQLEYEGYSEKACEYAVKNCGANWNEQAAKCAKSYLDYSSFSRSGLIEQLEYEGFTAKQAEYGAKAVGY